ncbi:hypothetical protein QC823_15340 [Halomonas vilamensis]|uniref:Uncharacterized protein n=1 Tax=Vreelandella vilamensis TaxID=531309 RepID=A0ABU1H881_9GAMM|nr:hypothetical protein [Halomonas vilamensis]MDR5900340.1 hypothetical protein [Halomonas vilamensis]
MSITAFYGGKAKSPTTATPWCSSIVVMSLHVRRIQPSSPHWKAVSRLPPRRTIQRQSAGQGASLYPLLRGPAPLPGNGEKVGSLCIIKTQPRRLEENEKELLACLALHVEEELVARLPESHVTTTALLDETMFRARASSVFSLCLRFGFNTVLVRVCMTNISRIQDRYGTPAGEELIQQQWVTPKRVSIAEIDPANGPPQHDSMDLAGKRMTDAIRVTFKRNGRSR